MDRWLVGWLGEETLLQLKLRTETEAEAAAATVATAAATLFTNRQLCRIIAYTKYCRFASGSSSNMHNPH